MTLWCDGAEARLLASVKYTTWKPTHTKWRSLAPRAKGRPLWLFRSRPSFVARLADLRVGLTGSAGGSGIARGFQLSRRSSQNDRGQSSNRHVCEKRPMKRRPRERGCHVARSWNYPVTSAAMAIVGCRRPMAPLLLFLLVTLSGAQEAARPEAAVDATEPHADPVPEQPRVEPAQSTPPSRAPRLRPRAALVAARPWSFTATASPVVLGAALAWRADDTFSPLRLGLALVTTLGVHAAGNLLNTLYDFKNGFDGTSSSDQTLVSGEMAPAQVATLVRYAYAIAALAAAPLCVVSSAPPAAMLLMLAAGASSAYVYTGGPGLKYRALGDALISITFGPLLVGFSYLAQAPRAHTSTPPPIRAQK